ncbi:hypothetical protein J116_027850 [Streptomyces thermolilacinus SPC6]|uniref:Uncharacterized protein n=1 Tax=Streptomyces thermolilacinus SPC6 TaxID=1306406 RepID=A0A1D3DZE5_9ACTN|nr:hypothetical protein J116_027850 [Streptomyces thermolilacinus SPC6]
MIDLARVPRSQEFRGAAETFALLVLSRSGGTWTKPVFPDTGPARPSTTWAGGSTGVLALFVRLRHRGPTTRPRRLTSAAGLRPTKAPDSERATPPTPTAARPPQPRAQGGHGLTHAPASPTGDPDQTGYADSRSDLRAAHRHPRPGQKAYRTRSQGAWWPTRARRVSSASALTRLR